MDPLTRGTLVLVALPGGYGKPRPALVVQTDLFNPVHASISLVPVTTSLVDAPLFRLTVDPSPGNGLRAVSQIMIDKLTAVRRDRVRRAIGQLETETLVRVNRALALWLGLAS